MRVLLAPTEIAGELGMTARALCNLGINAVSCNLRYKQNPYGYVCDIDFGPQDKTLSIRKKVSRFIFIFTSLFRFDVFHFYFGRTLSRKKRDLPLLKSLGKKLVIEFVGSDVRMDNCLPNIKKINLARKNPEKVIKNLKIFSSFIDVALVADWELKTYVEPYFKRVEIVRQRIELDKYMPKYPISNKKRPLIVHAPSNREFKGTEFVLGAIETLKAKHSFDFRLIENMKHSEAVKLYTNADVVVDQLRIGTHGGFAVECMALGKPVITYLRDESKEFYPKSLPIVSASTEAICEVLERLIINGTLRHDLGVRGRKYVEEFHDSIKVAKRLRSIYQSL
jgi:glycosyltransferase involved in cell wall biosynthesis